MYKYDNDGDGYARNTATIKVDGIGKVQLERILQAVEREFPISFKATLKVIETYRVDYADDHNRIVDYETWHKL